MLYLYLAALILGGALVGGSLLFGGDHDATGGGHDLAAEGWLPFLSLRFWTLSFFAAGLAGVLFEWRAPGAVLTPWLSLLVGFGGGWASTAALKRLARREVSSGLSAADFVGASARVLLPIEPGRRGKVRVTLKGQAHDLPAVVEGDDQFAVRDEVLVLEVRDEVARVAASVERRS